MLFASVGEVFAEIGPPGVVFRAAHATADYQAQRELLAKLDAGELSLDDLRNDAGAKEKRRLDELQTPVAKG